MSPMKKFRRSIDSMIEFAKVWASLSSDLQDTAEGVLADWSFEANPDDVRYIYDVLGGYDSEIDDIFEDRLEQTKWQY